MYKRAPTGQISVKFDIGCLYEICREYNNLIKMGQQYRAHRINTWVPSHCWQQYETLLCSSTAVQREGIVTLPWKHSAILFCWQLNVGQQHYKGDALLRSNSNSDHSLDCGATKLTNFTVLGIFCIRILKLLSQICFQSLSESITYLLHGAESFLRS